MRVALVHEWLSVWAGSERAVEAIAELYPGAPLHVLVHDKRATRGRKLVSGRTVHESFLAQLPWARRYFRGLAPLFPLAFERFDLDGFDVVISSHHYAAKSVLTRADQLHLCYCYSPLRFMHDLRLHTLATMPWLKRRVTELAFHRLRQFDVLSSMRVDHYAAISRAVAARIRKHYRRESVVIHPPVEVGRFTPQQRRDDFYLTVSRLIPQKRVDLIVEACRRMDRPLVVVGDGPELERLRRAYPRATFTGWLSDEAVADRMQRCRAFLFAAEEDFGIAPVEAMAAGAPVIAVDLGGVRDTVVPGEVGLLAPRQSVEDLVQTLRQFESLPPGAFPPEKLHEHARSFDRPVFQRKFAAWVERGLGSRE